MYKHPKLRYLADIYHSLLDLILIIFGGKNIRHFVLKVPHYCRYKCDNVFLCRNVSKDWRTRKGCLMMNYDVFTDEEEHYFEKGKEAECEKIRRKYRRIQK